MRLVEAPRPRVGQQRAVDLKQLHVWMAVALDDPEPALGDRKVPADVAQEVEVRAELEDPAGDRPPARDLHAGDGRAGLRVDIVRGGGAVRRAAHRRAEPAGPEVDRRAEPAPGERVDRPRAARADPQHGPRDERLPAVGVAHRDQPHRVGRGRVEPLEHGMLADELLHDVAVEPPDLGAQPGDGARLAVDQEVSARRRLDEHDTPAARPAGGLEDHLGVRGDELLERRPAPPGTFRTGRRRPR